MCNKGANRIYKGNKDDIILSNNIDTEIYTLNNVKVLYTNVRSLTSGNKREELQVLIESQNVDIVGITETWGKADITDGEIGFPGFKLYRKDRAAVNNKKGGGVALYVRNSLHAAECDDLNSKLCESVWCKIYVDKTKHFLVGVCYRSQEAGESELCEMFECIKIACDNNRSVLVMGDFNYPDINWTMLKADNNGQKFLKLVLDCYLEQHVLNPTRMNNILDLVLTNELNIKDGIQFLAPVDKSDHNVLTWSIECNNTQSIQKEQLCYNRADYVAMRAFVKRHLADIDSSDMTASTMWHYFNDIMKEAIIKFVPCRSAVSKSKPLWMTAKVLRSVKKKHKLWKKWRDSADGNAELKYKKQANKASKVVRSAKRDFERKIAKNIKKDSKSFFKYARSKTRVKTTVGPLLDANDVLVGDDKEMGELLNTFFASVFTKEGQDNLPAAKKCFHGGDNERLCTFTISPEMVKAKLAKLKMNKAPGVDLVGTRMLIELADEISYTVAELFNKSLSSGDIPQDWKLANITPIFKKGKKASTANYRPVSLTVNLCKVFESLVRDRMIEHLEKFKLIKDTQHGFVKNKSCLTNLLVFLEEVTNYIDSGYPVDVIYLDFQKAFDKVPHRRLIIKLEAHGIDGKILQWIENWLSNRKQRVVLNGQFSDWRDVLSGVPQGSVLGPLLFLIYINDIDESVGGRILKFADDTKVYNKMRSDEDIASLQSDLCNLVAWSKEWQMLFNVEKCKVMHIGYNNMKAEYFMDGVKLEHVTEEKDLGVIISEDLKWEKQCSSAVSKANRILGMIKRNFVDRSKETVLPLYKSLVRPHLEYCCQAWSPHYIKDVKLIEGVQRRATKLIKGMEKLHYKERLSHLGLMSLETRRVRGDLIEVYKFLNGGYTIDSDIFFEYDRAERRGHSKKLFKRRSRLDVRKYVFGNRVTDKWNTLPQCCVNCTTVNNFKSHIHNVLEPETK